MSTLGYKLSYRVIFCEDLPDHIKKQLDYGKGEDLFWALVEYHDGSPVFAIGCDGGEPEDQILVRDWKWVGIAMNKLANIINQKGGVPNND